MKDTDVAIIGWHIRFPGADSIEEFWQNLRNGVESTSFFTKEELRERGFGPEILDNPQFIPAAPIIKRVEEFDAAFFGVSPRDAELIDPQYRMFIEESWSALEDAGYDAEQYQGKIGVFAGANISRYLLDALKPLMDQEPSRAGSLVTALCFNDKDALATLVSYKLNLTGPAVNVQSFCSTSLVAVHLGCQSLRTGESDMVVAGGSNLNGRNAIGYNYQEGDILSPDGHCRTFDAEGKGTVFGSGVGAVVLKRLSDAIKDGDTIHAVIKASAVNNDGSNKAGYTAPSHDGQAAVVARAIELSGIDPSTIGYVEAHGTGTEVGDPIEVKGLTTAYRKHTDKKTYCAIGSVKTNFGHLDRAAGVSSLVKATLAVKHGQVPPTLHFKTPNPKIDFENSPFFVNNRLIDWPLTEGPRRAAVSGLGFGGTNAHAILEQAPAGTPSGASLPFQILPVSARTETALPVSVSNLAKHLQTHPDLAFADAAWTLQAGRRAFPHRQAVVSADAQEAISAIESGSTIRGDEMVAGERRVVFLFPGQGAQYVNMGRDLYDTVPFFKDCVDRCAETLKPHLGLDLREILYPAAGSNLDDAAARLKQTSNTQPALFVIEYATAALLEHWGIQASGMIGHSVGEYVAACLAGVFSLDDALMLVATRGRLMQSCPAGAMLAVMADIDVVRSYATDDVSVGAVNAPGTSVLSGTFEGIARVEAALSAAGIASKKLETSHAFHSAMMDSILAEFQRAVESAALSAPSRPLVSNITGRWIENGQATDAKYWVTHLREAVRFSDGMATLSNDAAFAGAAFIEVGPGRTLLTFAKRAVGAAKSRPSVQTMRQKQDTTNDLSVLLQTVAKLWVAGVEIEWQHLHDNEQRRRVPLPTYPFERTSFWLEPDRSKLAAAAQQAPAGKQSDVADWFYVPAWASSPTPAAGTKGDGRPWLVLGDGAFADVIEQRLNDAGEPVTRVSFGRAFSPGRAEDMTALFEKMTSGEGLPGYVIHAGNVQYGAALSNQNETQDRAFFSPLYLVQELGRANLTKPVRVGVVTDRLFALGGTNSVAAERATLLGPCRVTPREHAEIKTSAIDVAEITPANETAMADLVIAEMLGAGNDTVVAYRDSERFVQTYEKTRAAKPERSALPIKRGGCYLITGGTGGIGLTLAEHLAKNYHAKLILTSRSGMPAAGDKREQRIRDIEAHGVDVIVAAADVSDAASMKRAVEDAERRFGRIDGVFHTAGVPGGGAMQRKKRDVASRVLEPKVKGTLIIDALMKDRAPDFVMLFSSAAAVAGPFGQVDYCAANSFLDAFAALRHGKSSTLWQSVDWDDWAEVGMAVETSSRLGVGGDAAVSKPDSTEALTHPLFARKDVRGSATSYVANIGASLSWLLNEHVLFGEPTVPGSAYLEFARAAFECATGSAACEMRDMFVLKPMSVPRGTEREMSVILTPTARGFSFVIESGSGGERLEHVRGSIGAIAESDVRHDIAELREATAVQSIDESVLARHRAAREGGYLALGPRWNNAKQVRYGANTILGEHDLGAAFAADVDVFKLHPAFTDFTALFPLYLSQLSGQYVPFSYDAIRVRGPLPSRVRTWTRVKDSIENNPRTLRFDCFFLDDDGRELLHIDNLVLHLMEGHVRSESADPTSANFTLGLKTAGVLDSFISAPSERRAPGDGEVEIQVAAAGLNFRDVLRALGMLAAEHDAGAGVVGFGAECSGKIARVGPNVTDLAVGDDVLAFSTKSFSGFVTTVAKAVAKIPANMDFAQAASIPMVFLTAYHALNGIARVRKGERVLVHAAAGGVGLAAVQIAKMKGAEVIGTVGSQEKREFLEQLGVKHISTSRSLDFVDDVKKFTNGEGVDVVLNALAGDFIPASLGLLRTGGRFIEIGARDIYANASLGLRPFANNLTFSAFDLGQVAASDPDYLRQMLSDVLMAFDRGQLQLLPIQTYPVDEASKAFQFMAAARHIGKVVVSVTPMSRNANTGTRQAASTTAASGRDLSHGILPAEGMDAIERALALGRAQMIVTTRHLSSFVSNASSGASPAAMPTVKARTLHPRPALPTPYKAPETPEEQSVEMLWRDLLGIDKIGINDSFFELGGDSLLGVQLISLMKAKHSEHADNIRPADLYEGPTIRELARKLTGGADVAADAGDRDDRSTARKEQRERRRSRAAKVSE